MRVDRHCGTRGNILVSADPYLPPQSVPALCRCLQSTPRVPAEKEAGVSSAYKLQLGPWEAGGAESSFSLLLKA